MHKVNVPVIGILVLVLGTQVILHFIGLHRSTKYEVVIVIEIPIAISEIVFGVETESGLRIAPSHQVFE